MVQMCYLRRPEKIFHALLCVFPIDSSLLFFSLSTSPFFFLILRFIGKESVQSMLLLRFCDSNNVLSSVYITNDTFLLFCLFTLFLIYRHLMVYKIPSIFKIEQKTKNAS